MNISITVDNVLIVILSVSSKRDSDYLSLAISCAGFVLRVMQKKNHTATDVTFYVAYIVMILSY